MHTQARALRCWDAVDVPHTERKLTHRLPLGPSCPPTSPPLESSLCGMANSGGVLTTPRLHVRSLGALSSTEAFCVLCGPFSRPMITVLSNTRLTDQEERSKGQKMTVRTTPGTKQGAGWLPSQEGQAYWGRTLVTSPSKHSRAYSLGTACDQHGREYIYEPRFSWKEDGPCT